jgi:hypothetical protein
MGSDMVRAGTWDISNQGGRFYAAIRLQAKTHDGVITMYVATATVGAKKLGLLPNDSKYRASRPADRTHCICRQELINPLPSGHSLEGNICFP